jgi:hypothetical protein
MSGNPAPKFRVVKKSLTGPDEIVISDLHGDPLTRDQAERFASRCYAAEDQAGVTYVVEAF